VTPTEVAEQVAAELAKYARTAAGARISLAVPGGSVADVVFPFFAALAIDWSRVDITWVDERVVPPDHHDSNVYAAKRLWLNRLDPSARLIVPPYSPDADRMAGEWQTLLVEALGAPPRLDIVILGAGPDGHVASIFPNHPSLDRDDLWAAGVHDAPKPPPERVTLTPATLARANELWVVAFGSAKAAIVRDARDDPRSTLPLARVVNSGPLVRWFLDTAAAAQ
jgi:6-phosphogluconolactonase